MDPGVSGIPTLPVLTYREGRQRVIVIHPPLPDPVGDAVRDAAACRGALAPLIEAYVRRFPTQCRWVAIPRWPTDPPAGQHPERTRR
jgi:lauroyl/myristoyl acyltransferase